jgi:hypothetical protein
MKHSKKVIAPKAPGPCQSGLPSIEDLLKNLDPKERERALLDARIQILAEEIVATSAIEGITIDLKEARKAVLRQMARQAGLIR